jgi:hypothetical protein
MDIPEPNDELKREAARESAIDGFRALDDAHAFGSAVISIGASLEEGLQKLVASYLEQLNNDERATEFSSLAAAGACLIVAQYIIIKTSCCVTHGAEDFNQLITYTSDMVGELGGLIKQRDAHKPGERVMVNEDGTRTFWLGKEQPTER